MVMAGIFSEQSSSIFGYSPRHSGKRAMPTTLKEGRRLISPIVIIKKQLYYIPYTDPQPK